MAGRHRRPVHRRQHSAITVTSATLAAGGLLAGTASVGWGVDWSAAAGCESGGSAAAKAASGFYGAVAYVTVTQQQPITIGHRMLASHDLEAWPVCGRHAGDHAPARHAAASPPRHAAPIAPGAPLASPASLSRTVDYVVDTGDSLAQIAAAQSVPGGWQRIYQDNRDSIADPNVINVGQHLKLLAADAAAVTAAPPAVAARPVTPKRVTPAPPASAKPFSATSAAVPAAKTVDLRLATRVVTAALAQQGTPYVYGGDAPGGFDCSGLVQWSYRKVGVTLPRTAAAQATVGRRVNLNQLQPGDLLFYYQPVGHVVMYVGNGKIVEASQPGQPIRVRPMYLNGFVTARRVL